MTCIEENGGQMINFFKEGRLACGIDCQFPESKMSAEVGKKELKHNFGVLNQKNTCRQA